MIIADILQCFKESPHHTITGWCGEKAFNQKIENDHTAYAQVSNKAMAALKFHGIQSLGFLNTAEEYF